MNIDYDERPDFVFSMAGMSYGPDETVLEKSAVSCTLAKCLGMVERGEHDDLCISFYFETEGSLFDKRVKPGPGRRSHYARLNLASVTIGITMDDLRLPLRDYAALYCRYIKEGYEHLIPYLRKKEIAFEEDRLRSELHRVVDAFFASGRAREYPSDEQVRQFLLARHPDLVERIKGYGKGESI